MSFTCSSLFQNFSNTILSLFDWSKGQSKCLSFSSDSFARFLSFKVGKTFLPFLFHLFSSFMQFFMHFGNNFEPVKIWGFWWFKPFLHNWSMGFCCGMIYNCSMWINLINLLNWENLEFLGPKTTRIGDFVQLGLIWWNWLVGLIHMIIIMCYLSCVMINWSISWKLYKWFFKILGFLI